MLLMGVQNNLCFCLVIYYWTLFSNYDYVIIYLYPLHLLSLSFLHYFYFFFFFTNDIHTFNDFVKMGLTAR